MEKLDKISKEYILSLNKIITDTNCWIRENSNYISFHSRNYILHRIVAYLWHGGFDLFTFDGTLICHRCKNDTTMVRVCFNPEHIYVGTNSSNMLDAVKAKTHVQFRKTHCPQGHLYDEYAKRYGKRTERRCSTCRREALRRWKAKRRSK